MKLVHFNFTESQKLCVTFAGEETELQTLLRSFTENYLFNTAVKKSPVTSEPETTATVSQQMSTEVQAPAEVATPQERKRGRPKKDQQGAPTLALVSTQAVVSPPEPVAPPQPDDVPVGAEEELVGEDDLSELEPVSDSPAQFHKPSQKVLEAKKMGDFMALTRQSRLDGKPMTKDDYAAYVAQYKDTVPMLKMLGENALKNVEKAFDILNKVSSAK